MKEFVEEIDKKQAKNESAYSSNLFRKALKRRKKITSGNMFYDESGKHIQLNDKVLKGVTRCLQGIYHAERIALYYEITRN